MSDRKISITNAGPFPMGEQWTVCGGELDEDARRELEAFSHHLRNHPRGHTVKHCRFCRERQSGAPLAQRALSPTSEHTEER